MVYRTNTNYEELQFDHMVEFSEDATVFAAARQNGFIRLFLIKEFTGSVYARNGRADAWEPVMGEDRDRVIAVLGEARNNTTPLYRINAKYL